MVRKSFAGQCPGWAFFVVPPLLTALVLGILYAVGGLYPFGGKTLAWCDMNQQVIPLMMQLKDAFRSNGTLLFSSAAGGMNFWGVLFFFLASPFSLLCLLVEKKDFPFLMNVLVMLKLSLCALTAAFYFRKRVPALGTLAVPLSTAYALCGYGLMYYQNLVWLDMMALFPLLMLSLWMLAEQEKVLPYVLAMAAAVAINYYIGYMAVLFVLLFMGTVLAFSPKEGRRRMALRFVIGSGAAAALSAAVWLPSFIQYLSSGRGGDIVKGLRNSSLFGQLYTNLPLFLATGMVIPVLAMLLQRRCRQGQSRPQAVRVHLALFGMLVLPFVLEPVNKMWHTGSYMAFSVRYGFMAIFVGLSLAGELLSDVRPKERPDRGIAWAFVGLAAALVCFGFIYYQKYAAALSCYVRTLWGNQRSFRGILLFAGVAMVCYELLLMARRRGKLSRALFSALTTLVVLAEGLFYGQVYIVSAKDKLNVADWQKAVGLAGQLPEGEFYRVKSDRKRFDVNLIAGMGYPTFAHYTSLTPADTLETMKRLGYSGYWMELGAHGGTAFSDALLAVRYQIVPDGKTEAPLFQNGRYAIEELPDALPLGIATDAELPAALPDGSRIPLQQWLFRKLLETDGSIFTQYQPRQAGCLYQYADGRHQLAKDPGQQDHFLLWEIPVEGVQTLYFDCFDKATNALKEPVNDSFQIAVNGQEIAGSYPTQALNGLLELGTFEDETVVVTAKLVKPVHCRSLGVWGLDREKLSSSLQTLQGVTLTQKGNGFTGVFENTDSKAYCLLTLPWDDGYRVTVNGKAVVPQRCLGAFFTIPLDAGENRIQIVLTPKGLPAGLVLSIAGALALALWGWKGFALPKRRFWGGIALWASWGAAGAAVLAVYLLPLGLCLFG